MRLSIIAGLICTVLAALAVACGGDDDKGHEHARGSRHDCSEWGRRDERRNRHEDAEDHG